MAQIDEPQQPTSAATEPTEEQRAQVEAWLRAHPYGEQDENGIDISYLREILKLTPTQRLEKHDRALRVFLEGHRAGKAARVGNPRTVVKTPQNNENTQGENQQVVHCVHHSTGAGGGVLTPFLVLVFLFDYVQHP